MTAILPRILAYRKVARLVNFVHLTWLSPNSFFAFGRMFEMDRLRDLL